MPLLSLASRCSTALLLAVMLSSSHDTSGLLLPKSLATVSVKRRTLSNETTALQSSSQPQPQDDSNDNKGGVWRKFFVPYQEAVDSQNAPTSYMVNREEEDEAMSYPSQPQQPQEEEQQLQQLQQDHRDDEAIARQTAAQFQGIPLDLHSQSDDRDPRLAEMEITRPRTAFRPRHSPGAVVYDSSRPEFQDSSPNPTTLSTASDATPQESLKQANLHHIPPPERPKANDLPEYVQENAGSTLVPTLASASQANVASNAKSNTYRSQSAQQLQNSVTYDQQYQSTEINVNAPSSLLPSEGSLHKQAQAKKEARPLRTPFQPRAKPAGAQVYNFQAYPEETDTETNALPVDEIQPTVHPDQHSFDTTQSVSTMSSSIGLQSEGSYQQQQDKRKELSQPKTPFQSNRHKGATYYSLDDPSALEGVHMPLEDVKKKPFDPTTDSVSQAPLSFGMQSEGNYHRQKESQQEIKFNKTPFRPRRHEGARNYLDDQSVLEGVNMPFEQATTKKPFDPSTDSVSQAPLAFGMQSEGNYHQTKESKQEIKFNKTPFRARKHEGARNYLEDQEQAKQQQSHNWDPSQSVSAAPLSLGLSSEGSLQRELEQQREMSFNRTPFQGRKVQGAKKYLDEQEEDASDGNQQQEWDRSQSVSAAPLSLGMQSEGDYHKEKEAKQEMSFNKTPFQGRKVEGAKKYLDEQQDAQGNDLNWDRSQSVSAAPLSLGMQSEGNYHKEKEAKQEMSFNKTPFQGRKVAGATKWLEQNVKDNDGYNFDRSSSVSAAPNSLGLQSEASYQSNEAKKINKEVSPIRTPFTSRKVKGAENWLEKQQEELNDYNFDRSQSVSTAENTIGLMNDVALQAKQGKQMDNAKIKTPFRGRQVDGASKYLVDGPMEQQDDEAPAHVINSSQNLGIESDVTRAPKLEKDGPQQNRTPFRPPKNAGSVLFDPSTYDPYAEEPVEEGSSGNGNLDFVPLDGMPRHRPATKKGTGVDGDSGDVTIHHDSSNVRVGEASKPKTPFEFNRPDGATRQVYDSRETREVANSGMTSIFADHDVRLKKRSERDTPMSPFRPARGTGRVYAPSTTDIEQEATEPEQRTFFDSDVRQHYQAEKEANKPITPFKVKRTGTAQVYDPSNLKQEQGERAVASSGYSSINMDNNSKMHTKSETGRPITPFDVKDKVNAAKRTGQLSNTESVDEVDVGAAPFSVHRTASSVNVQGAYKSQLPTDTIPSRNRNPLHTDLREAGYQERSDSAVSPASSQEQMQELRTHSESKPSTSLSDVLPANFTSSSPGGTFSDSVSTYDG